MSENLIKKFEQIKLNTRLDKTKLQNLDSLLTILKEIIEEKDINQLQQEINIEQLERIKSIINNIYLLLNNQLPKLSPQETKEIMEWTTGKKVILDLEETKKEYKLINSNLISISPDGEKYAFWAKKRGKVMAVINGQEIIPENFNKQASYILFSPDSNHYAFFYQQKTGLIRTKQHYSLFQDGKIWKTKFLDTDNFLFSPNSQKLAATGEIEMTKQKKTYFQSMSTVVENDKPWEFGFSDRTVTPVYSPDSKNLAAYLDRKSVV